MKAMNVRHGLATILVGVTTLTTAAHADSFGGVSGNEKWYLVGRDRVCQPLAVTAGKARGGPVCKPGATEEVAALSLKTPAAERGAAAQVRATAKLRTITVTRVDGSVVVSWDAPDPVASIVDVWRSTYGRLIVVEYTVRRAGSEVHEVVGFDVGVGGGSSGGTTGGPSGGPTPPDGGAVKPPPDGGATAAPDPALVKAADKARKAKGKAALAAWAKVVALDGDHAEAHYRLAALLAASKKPGDALPDLERLAASTRPDAAEWLVEARFDKAFAKLVAEPRFRAAVGLDRAAATPYERLMGLGGQWEQSLTPCDRPELKVTLRRDRSFRLDFRSVCEGQREAFTMKGTWTQRDAAIELRLKKPEGGVDAAPCLLGRDRDEDTLTCQLDADLSFEARPARR